MKVNSLKKMFSVLLLVYTTNVMCQKMYGVAHYQSATDVQISDFSGRNMTKAQKQQYSQIMKDFFKKEYVLYFTNKESIYKQEEKLDHPMSDNRLSSKLGHFVKGPQYKSTETNRYIRSQEFLGKVFLIRDSITEFQWKVTDETKKIGRFTCYKATTSFKIEEVNWKSTTLGKNEKKKDQEEIDVVAWFTPEIPINQGPDIFWGLPGLILEANSGRTSIVCTLVEVKSWKGEKIDKPLKGKVVSHKEYVRIARRKLEDLKSRSGRRRRKN